MSEENTKREIYAAQFYPFLDSAVDKWRARRIIPYSRCYADAYSVFTKTRDKAISDRELRLQLYVAVGMLVGTGLCGLAPLAGMLTATKQGLIWKVASLSHAMEKIGIAGRVPAWKVMSTFTFKMLPAGSQLWWSDRGKKLFTDSLSTFQGTLQPGIAAGSIKPVRGEASRETLPIEYYLELEGLILKAKNALTDFFEKMIKDSQVTAREFEDWCVHSLRANFIAKAPKSEFSLASMEKIANEMELALWTQAALSWKWMGTERNSLWTGERVRDVAKYSDFWRTMECWNGRHSCQGLGHQGL